MQNIPLQHQVAALLRRSDAFDLSKEARVRLKWLSYFSEHGGNVSRTCRHFGISRSTFRRWLERFNPDDLRSLEADVPRRRPRTIEPDLATVEFVRESRTSDPYAASGDIADRLLRERGVSISPATVGRIIQRHAFFFGDSPAHLRKREEASDFGRAQPSQKHPSLLPSDGDESIASAFPVFGS